MDPAALLGDLIRAARDGPLATLDAAGAALRALGFTERRTAGAPVAALFTRGTDARLVLSGHVDVVPAGAGWDGDPFSGAVREGRVWGRGACDMLGSVGCFAAAASRAPDAPCAILLTTDEETTMEAASVALDEGLLDRSASVVVGEPTGMDVGVAEKGVLWVTVEARGRTAHGSMPELGENAIDKLVRALDRVRSARPKGTHPLLGEATLSVNRIDGGLAVNQVPAEARAEVDVRYLPGQDALGDITRAAKEADAHVAVLGSHLPFETEAGSRLARAAIDAARAAGRTPRAVGFPYGTEASKFAPAGSPTVIFGPGEAGLAHTARESIRLADLEAGAVAYAHMLRAFAERAP